MFQSPLLCTDSNEFLFVCFFILFCFLRFRCSCSIKIIPPGASKNFRKGGGGATFDSKAQMYELQRRYVPALSAIVTSGKHCAITFMRKVLNPFLLQNKMWTKEIILFEKKKLVTTWGWACLLQPLWIQACTPMNYSAHKEGNIRELLFERKLN